MGASIFGLAFFSIVGVIYITACFFVLFSAVLIVVWKKKKRSGRPWKRRWLILPVAFLVVNGVVVLFPVVHIGYMRYGNSPDAPEIVYAQSGKTLYWSTGESGRFEMDGRQYVFYDKGNKSYLYDLVYTQEQLGEPVANILEDSSYGAFNNLISLMSSGRTLSELKICTVYPVINDNQFEFYFVKRSSYNNTIASGTYCPEDRIDEIKAYYQDLSNYDTENPLCEYSVYTTDGENRSGTYRDAPYTTVKYTVSLNPGTYDTIAQMLEDRDMRGQIEIPQKYLDMEEAAVPGTPIYGYDQRKLTPCSKDKMAMLRYEHIYFVLLDSQVYAMLGSGAHSGDIEGWPLPGDMNQYIMDTVFAS